MAMVCLQPLVRCGRAPELLRLIGGARLVVSAMPPSPPQASVLAAAMGAGLPPREPQARPMTHLSSPQLSLVLPIVVERGLATKAVVRDPERPKRPESPWVRFLGDFRQQRKEVAPKEVMKVAAVEWKTIPDFKKSQWVQPYEAEKKTYDKAFKEYSDSGKLAAWKRDPEKPKRPLTPFLEYTGEFRKKNAGLKLTEVTKQSAASWKLMTAEQKAPYEKRYEEASKKHKVAMEQYQASGKEAAWKAKKGPSPKELLKQKEAAKRALEVKAAQKVKEAAKKAKDKEIMAKQKEAAAAKKAKKKEADAAAKAKKKALATAKKVKKEADAAAKAKKKAVETAKKVKKAEQAAAKKATAAKAATASSATTSASATAKP